MSWIATAVPAGAFALAWSCVQNVLPTPVSTYWAMRDCPAAGVRAMALSQSLPTAHTQAPVVGVVTATVGGPLAPLVALVLGVVLVAPSNAASVMLPAKPVASGVAVTRTLLSRDAAQAVHTSAVPACASDRTASVHVRPPPAM